MPYNPGSAYPRQTTWTPHSHPNGLGIVKAVNDPQIGSVPKVRGAASFAGYGSAYAKHQGVGMGQLSNAIAGPVGQILNKPGFIEQMAAKQREQAGLQQNRRRPTAPGNPQATANKAEAEHVVEDMAGSVVASPSAGTTTASPSIFIPPTRRVRTR